MYLVKTALPMFQALALMCIYIAIPFAVPFAVLKPSLLLFFTSAIFTLKFMTGLWALAALLDDKLSNTCMEKTRFTPGLEAQKIWFL